MGDLGPKAGHELGVGKAKLRQRLEWPGRPARGTLLRESDLRGSVTGEEQAGVPPATVIAPLLDVVSGIDPAGTPLVSQ
jgi:hypothetical protein